jgi:hypothetical protein
VTITLEFGEADKAGGQSGCNSYGGTYTVQNDSLKFEEVTSTLIACSDQAVNDQEGQYLQALRTASHFTSDGHTITIWYQDEGGVLNFTRSTPTTPEPPGGTPPGQGAERIRLPQGDTSIEIFADVPARGSDLYVLRAEEGQFMSVEITSPDNDVLLEIVGEDGTPLKRYQNGPPSWTSQLPATQDYFIRAVSVGGDTSYTMSVSVEPVSSPPRERVEFESGATSANRSGTLPEGGVKEYVLFAAAGQSMHVQTVGDSAPVEFTLTSPSGETWTGEQQPAGAYIFTVQVPLPEDGDYVVRLSVSPGTGDTRYDVAFTILDGVQATPPTSGEPPERVIFEPGATSAQRNSLLPSGFSVKQYVLTGNAGQIMTVDIFSDDVPLSMTITMPSGMQRIPEMFPAEGGGYLIGHEFTLPESGDYLVTLTKADHTPSTNYTADFAIK